MVNKPYILAIDIGTTKIKLAIFDSIGNLLDYTFSEYPLDIKGDEIVEQNPLNWIDGFEKCINRLRERGKLRYVRSISVIGQAPTVVFVEKSGKVLRNAILWLDKRAQREKDHLARLGLPFDPRYQSLAHILWIASHEQEIYDKTSYFLQPYDFLNLYFTGIPTSSGIPHRDYMPWSKDDAKLLGLSPDKFLDITPMGTPIGTLKFNLRREWGIEDDVIVVSGGIDFIGALLGTATLKPGILCDRGGGSEGITVCAEKGLPSSEKRISSVRFFLPNAWKISGITNTSGKAIDWAKELFEIRSYQELFKIAKKSPPGSRNLVFLPYLLGERSPHWDPFAKGVFFGLTLFHKKEDILRSVLEGIVYSIREIYEIILSHGIEVKHFRTTGGLSKSDFFNQLKADILGIPVEVPYISDGELLGAAMIAGMGIGLYKDLKEASSNMYRPRRILYPNPLKKPLYDELFSVYKSLYPDLAQKFRYL